MTKGFSPIKEIEPKVLTIEMIKNAIEVLERNKISGVSNMFHYNFWKMYDENKKKIIKVSSQIA